MFTSWGWFGVAETTFLALNDWSYPQVGYIVLALGQQRSNSADQTELVAE
jgi:hypothetical protein